MFIVKTLSISGMLYLAPKAFAYFSTKPEEVHTRLDRLREKIAGFSEASKTILGERAWFVLTDVFSKNAWISFLAISYLTRNQQPFETVVRGIEVASAFFVFCTAAAFARYGAQLFNRKSLQ